MLAAIADSEGLFSRSQGLSCGREEGVGNYCLLVGEDVGEADEWVIIDIGIIVYPTDTPANGLANVVANPTEAHQGLDFQPH